MSLYPALHLWAGLAAVGAVADPPAEKSHTLFMGADVSIGLNHQVLPVTDVEGSSWIVLKNGEPTAIPTKMDAVQIKITPVLKLTEKSVTVAGLRVERGYTFANDPSVRQTRALADAAQANTGYAAAVNQANAKADMSTAQAETGILRPGGVLSSSTAGGPPGSSAATRQFTPATSQDVAAANYLQTTAGADNETTGERNSTGYDAMDVDFDVSSARLLRNPYVVTMIRFHPHGAPAGAVQSLIYAKSLDPIDAHPMHVHLEEGGFPPGFEPAGFQLHVYDRGEEIATSVSDQRVALTRDEAFEYLLATYVGSHPHDTLPAVPVMGHVSSDLPVRLRQGQYAEPIYVRVSKDGLPESLYRDPACTQPLTDPYADALVRGLRFDPALDHGRPVDGVSAVQFRQLLKIF